MSIFKKEKTFLIMLICITPIVLGLYSIIFAITFPQVNYSELISKQIIIKSIEVHHGRSTYYQIKDTDGELYNISGKILFDDIDDFKLEALGKNAYIKYYTKKDASLRYVEELTIDNNKYIRYTENKQLDRIAIIVIGVVVILMSVVITWFCKKKL